MTPIEWFGLIGFALLGMGFVAHLYKANLYKANLDKLRLDALQTYQWQVGCIGGEFGVLAGSPPKMLVGTLKPSVREAIDAAILERQANRGN